MRIIGLEEHFWTSEIGEALGRLGPDQRDDSVALFQTEQIASRLEDLGEGRLKQMDMIGLDMMVLSVTTPGTQVLSPEEAVPLALQANDRLATAIKAHPDRFDGFATLPTPDPTAAVRELGRAVQDLGLRGAMIHGRTGDRYLDHEDFRPLLRKAADLGVPIYLHPQIAPRPVRALHFDGFDERLSVGFATGGWGWHVEAGITALRLIVAGVFDELPSLQIVLGHWGEMVPFFLERAAGLSRWTNHLKKPVADYFHQNFFVTASGMYSTTYLQRAIEVMGIDHVMYSSDYPFQYHEDGLARRFLENSPLSPEDKSKIAHANAEKLLGISQKLRY